jgi:hypothetical protein
MAIPPRILDVDSQKNDNEKIKHIHARNRYVLVGSVAVREWS